MPTPVQVRDFVRHHYRHFNSAVVVDASEAWNTHLAAGDKMMLTLAGAMSSAELGLSLAELIRQDKVHAICCTGANLEEDVFNLVANSHYERVPGYRDLSAEDEMYLYERGMNRVTDTCIPEDVAMRKIEDHVLGLWQKAEQEGERYFPHEYLYQLLLSGVLDDELDIDPKHSWLIAAAEKNLPMFVPGWEDSTLGNMFVSNVRKEKLEHLFIMKNGLEYMDSLIDWYLETTAGECSVGFFQIGGGIAGDFPICVVPLIRQDLEKEDVKLWSYFCQISDSTTSYGSYSGAVPNEKITWGKLSVDCPKFIIESDATIVAPLVFQYVLAGND
ncbi:MAG: deoxyhypusine synthase family protein [Deltaproteobacteria bacterium]|nr:deoxyhypusine synthase family protein [Deltaproteobacteria bacterium]